MSDADDSESGGESNPVMKVVRLVVPNFIRARFALKFLLVLLIMGTAIGAIGALGTATITDQTQDRIENEYSSLADQEANIVGQWLQRNEVATRLSSGESIWASNETNEMNTAANNRLSSFPHDASAIHIYEAGDQHEIVASSNLAPGATLENSPRAWAIDQNFNRETSVKSSSVYSGGGGGVVGFVSPVEGTENRYLLIEVAVNDLASNFQGADRAAGGFTLVTNESGTVLIDERMSDPEADEDKVLSEYGDRRARQPIDDALALTKNTSGVTSQMPANSDIIDEEYAVGYAPVITSGTENWVVLVHGPTSEVFGFVQTVSEWGLIATAAAVLLIGLIGAVLGYNTSTSIDRLTAKAKEMEAGNLDVIIHSNRIDNIGQLYDGFAEMRDALREQINEAESARKEAEVSRAEAMEISNYLQDKAEEYSETMQACARGDLTRRMEPEGENEAMDQIAEDFNEMLSELEMTTGQLKTFAVEVEEGGRGVQQSAETVRDASEQVADSVQKISDDAYDQKERLQSLSEEMDGVADQLERFADAHPEVDFGDALATIQEIAGMIDEATALGEETMAESENVAGAAEEQAAELNEVSSRAEELVRYAQYLGDGLNNFETEEEHEFVFQTGAGGAGPESDAPESGE